MDVNTTIPDSRHVFYLPLTTLPPSPLEPSRIRIALPSRSSVHSPVSRPFLPLALPPSALGYHRTSGDWTSAGHTSSRTLRTSHPHEVSRSTENRRAHLTSTPDNRDGDTHSLTAIGHLPPGAKCRSQAVLCQTALVRCTSCPDSVLCFSCARPGRAPSLCVSPVCGPTPTRSPSPYGHPAGIY